MWIRPQVEFDEERELPAWSQLRLQDNGCASNASLLPSCLNASWSSLVALQLRRRRRGKNCTFTSTQQSCRGKTVATSSELALTLANSAARSTLLRRLSPTLVRSPHRRREPSISIASSP